MTRTRKLAAAVLLAAATFASALTAALAFDSTETYAYLPDHSVSMTLQRNTHGRTSRSIPSR